MTDQLQTAAALTTAQLEQAIEIVEAELGADVEYEHASLSSGVLVTLAENYRQLPRVASVRLHR